jgi:hypothetical protein
MRLGDGLVENIDRGEAGQVGRAMDGNVVMEEDRVRLRCGAGL